MRNEWKDITHIPPRPTVTAVVRNVFLAVGGNPRIDEYEICDERRDGALQYGRVTAYHVLGHHFRGVVLGDDLTGEKKFTDYTRIKRLKKKTRATRTSTTRREKRVGIFSTKKKADGPT